MNKSIIWSLVLLIIVAAFYRIIPNRPYGFAPHLAMALFAGTIIKDKKWAFALPLFSIFLSDLLYEVLYMNGLTEIRGFYDGQITNYILFTGITCIGFLMKRVTGIRVLGFAFFTATVFFLASNFMVWINGAGFIRPKTWSGLLQCYTDALPFYRGSLIATVTFSIILFGGYYFLYKSTFQTKTI
ncbi:MAG: DUF6580 family putative transport protein [Chitinophagaceae bacterium]